MRCQLIGAAVTAALLFSACGGNDSAANGGMQSGESQAGQPMGQTGSAGKPASSAAGSAAAGSNAGGKASSSASGGAAGSPAKNAGTTTPGMGTASAAGAGGTAASTSGMTAAAGSGMAASTGAAGAGAAAGSGAAGSAGAAAAMTDACDRKCLLDVMQQYLDALVAHDPSKLKVAASVKVTDNGVVSKLGDGIFKTGTMVLNDHRLDYADPVEKNVGTQVVVNEGMTGVIFMARLKVVNHEITEIETMTVRRQGAANGFFNIDNMKPEKVFLQEVAPEKRLTRDKLKEITELYLDYLEGKKSGPMVPFDEGCKRYENGQVTASGLSSFNAQSWGFMVTRRILVIDEEAQITWGMFPFFQTESTLVVGEAFKIIEGKIMMIQAVMANQPAKVWD